MFKILFGLGERLCLYIPEILNAGSQGSKGKKDAHLLCFISYLLLPMKYR